MSFWQLVVEDKDNDDAQLCLGGYGDVCWGEWCVRRSTSSSFLQSRIARSTTTKRDMAPDLGDNRTFQSRYSPQSEGSERRLLSVEMSDSVNDPVGFMCEGFEKTRSGCVKGMRDCWEVLTVVPMAETVVVVVVD
ncbi:hypothetical protein RJT34_12842 [Clitoria ternatea]|uniref:Uncharacterized protein n=1 Tax=Clitoria ternatea TaxID=43366 RepID=A0AAN9JMH9_CLITE